MRKMRMDGWREGGSERADGRREGETRLGGKRRAGERGWETQATVDEYASAVHIYNMRMETPFDTGTPQQKAGYQENVTIQWAIAEGQALPGLRGSNI
eukprot:5275344-Pyramimonas_sp.AAC.1